MLPVLALCAVSCSSTSHDVRGTTTTTTTTLVSRSAGPVTASLPAGGLQTPEAIAARLQSVTGAAPILVPTAVPDGWSAEVSTGSDAFEIHYTGPSHEDVRLSISVPNPPPPAATGTQEFGFRGDPRALYQRQDATDPLTQRFLIWNEPGRWAGSTTPGGDGTFGVPYFLSATRVTEAVFWQIADTFTALPLPARPTTPEIIVDPAHGLRDNQGVRVVFIAFGPGSRVRLSQCASAQAVTAPGCGELPQSQPFADLDSNGNGSTIFVVRNRASTTPGDTTNTVTCKDECVLVASTNGAEGTPTTAPLHFG